MIFTTLVGFLLGYAFATLVTPTPTKKKNG